MYYPNDSRQRHGINKGNILVHVISSLNRCHDLLYFTIAKQGETNILLTRSFSADVSTGEWNMSVDVCKRYIANQQQIRRLHIENKLGVFTC